MYAISKLLIQYCVNEIAKLAIGPDGMYVIPITSTYLTLTKLQTTSHRQPAVPWDGKERTWTRLSHKSTHGSLH